MALETTTYIDGLVSTNPASGDAVSQADDHLRLIKSAVKSTFPNISGAMNATHGELNLLTSATATVIGRAYGEYSTYAAISTIIPSDDTIPQNTEGAQILSVAYTPKSVTNRLRLRFQCEAAASSSGLSMAAALFSSASASAMRAVLTTVTTASYAVPLVIEHEYVPATTSALTFTVRVGPVQAGTLYINGNNTTRIFGGVMAATLVIEEIAV